MSERLGRMVTLGRWTNSEGCESGEVPADAVTDLKTMSNRLSFYCVGEDDLTINAAIAIVANKHKNKIEKVNLAVVLREPLEAAGVNIDATAGETALKSMINQHRDAAKLDAYRLVEIAKAIQGAMPDAHCFTARQMKDALKLAIKNGDLDPADLHENIRNDLA